MAEEMPRADEVQNLTPEQVARGLTEGRMLLVDVREPNETSVESYPDAVIVPLSAFDPAAVLCRRSAADSSWLTASAIKFACSGKKEMRRSGVLPCMRQSEL